MKASQDLNKEKDGIVGEYDKILKIHINSSMDQAELA